MTDIKTVPHDDEAERALLGCVLLDNRTLSSIKTQPDQLYRDKHRVILSAMIALHERGDAIDAITIFSQLDARGRGLVGGNPQWLASLSRDTPSAVNVLAYDRRVQEVHERRELIAAFQTFDGALRGDVQDMREVRADIQHRVMDLTARGAADARRAADVMDETLRRLEQQIRGLIPAAPRCGLHALDDLLGGFTPGELVIIAARPAIGKSALGMDIALRMASPLPGVRPVDWTEDHGDDAWLHMPRPAIPVGVVTPEMTAQQLMRRAISNMARVDSNHLRDGNLHKGEWSRVIDAASRIAEMPMHIDDTSYEIHDVCASIRRLVVEHGVQWVLVDYLQKIKVKRAPSRHERVALAAEALSELCKELNITIVALAQVNRNVESREDKLPLASDLKEAGEIEQEAHVIVTLSRDEAYNTEDSDRPGIMDGRVCKNREGSTGVFQLKFEGKHTRCDNL